MKRLARLHPAARLLIAVQLAWMPFFSSGFNLLLLTVVPVALLTTSPRLKSSDPVWGFFRLLLFATAFLFPIHVIDIHFGIRPDGLRLIADVLMRLITIFATFAWLIRTLQKEDFFAILLSLRTPLVLIFVLFKAAWFVPIIYSRSKEILIAQQLRGHPMNSFRSRFAALTSSTNALFNSILLEIEESSVALVAKGISIGGRKEPYKRQKWVFTDSLFVGCLLAILYTLFFLSV